jgi:hypothetical protein
MTPSVAFALQCFVYIKNVKSRSLMEKEGARMSVNFYPNREKMIKEVEQCAASGMLEVLQSLCKCCVYKILDESILVSECHRCRVRQGISEIETKGITWTQGTADLDFLGVC